MKPRRTLSFFILPLFLSGCGIIIPIWHALSPPSPEPARPPRTPEPPPVVITASFDCSDPLDIKLSERERLVCSSKRLADIDIELATVYTAVLKEKPEQADEIKEEQAKWLEGAEKITNVRDLWESYDERLWDLEQIRSDCINVGTAHYDLIRNGKKAETAYKKCIAGGNPTDLRGIAYIQNVSRFYLAYLYMTDGEFKNVSKANALMKEATDHRIAQCGHEDHVSIFCYAYTERPIVGQTLHLPDTYTDRNQLLPVMNLTVSCFNADMIIDNPRILDTIDELSFYHDGASSAKYCAEEGSSSPYKVLSIDLLKSSPDYSRLPSVRIRDRFPEYGSYDPDGSEDWFRFSLNPEAYFKDAKNDPDKIVLFACGNSADERLFPDVMKEATNKYPDLASAYEKQIEETTTYYRTVLHLAPEQADIYAKKAVDLMIARDSFYTCKKSMP